MNNGNGPPARIQFPESVDGKLNSHLEWPYTMTQTNSMLTSGFNLGYWSDVICMIHSVVGCIIIIQESRTVTASANRWHLVTYHDHSAV